MASPPASRPPERAAPSRAARHRLLAAGLGLALLGAGGAPPAFAQGRLVQVDILDRDTGQPLRVYRDHGRPVVAGRPGARYAVRVANRSGERVMVVVAIDGVNILTGETASYDQDGYVLEPGQTAALTGWRKSHTEVAAFEFASLADSYAARTGRPDDVGVIGVATFREKPAPVGAGPGPADLEPVPVAPPRADAAPPVAPNAAADAAPPATSAAPAARGEAVAESRLRRVPAEPGERLGTGHGRREASWVVDTRFDRLSPQPQEVVRIRYDSLPDLVAAGLVPRRVAEAPPWPARAFPGSEPGFVPDPPAR